MLDKLDENKSSSEHKQRMMSGKVEGSRIWKTLYKPMSQMRITMSMTSSKTRDDIIFYHTFSFFLAKSRPLFSKLYIGVSRRKPQSFLYLQDIK